MEKSQKPTSGTARRVAAYVDGFNLYFGMRADRLKRLYWLDIHRIAVVLLEPDQELVGCKYFTARIAAPPLSDQSIAAIVLRDRRQRQTLYLDALATVPDLRIVFGKYLAKPGWCRNCGSTWPSYEEKMTDVNIATELLTDAFTDQFDTALVISADSDLVPPIRAIRSHFPNKRVIVAFPPQRRSKALQAAAHGFSIIGRDSLVKSQLPDEIIKPDGFILKRPVVWR